MSEGEPSETTVSTPSDDERGLDQVGGRFFFPLPTNDEQRTIAERLRMRPSPRRIGEQPDPCESWFEVDVALELLRRKYKVRPQYEMAGYRIDLVVEGFANDRLAVECDGDAWHGPERYEEDMARQRQLERAGLTFLRLGESDFYADRARAATQIVEDCNRLDIWPADHFQATASRESMHGSHVTEASAKTAENDDFVRDGNVDAESTTFRESESTPEFGPFTGYSRASGFPDPRETSPANIRAALRQIIEKDGPLTRDSVYRLYVEGCPALQRVGKAV